MFPFPFVFLHSLDFSFECLHYLKYSFPFSFSFHYPSSFIITLAKSFWFVYALKLKGGDWDDWQAYGRWISIVGIEWNTSPYYYERRVQTLDLWGACYSHLSLSKYLLCYLHCWKMEIKRYLWCLDSGKILHNKKIGSMFFFGLLEFKILRTRFYSSVGVW